DELGEAMAGADAVLVAARGPLVRVVAQLASTLTPRPVIITGLPGISIPATRKALEHRRACDLFVLHSHREIREFTALARERGIEQRFALASLPFAVGADTSDAPIDADATDLVFATQAIVPRSVEDRLVVARILVAAARAHPGRRVVVKLRGRAGEAQTHAEHDPFPELIQSLGEVPPNLVFSTVSMGEALDHAEGLVTVSSTAIVEAIARGIPALAIDTFGVAPKLINLVFESSGLFGSAADVVERRFRHPDAGWLRDNYFHDQADNDFVATLCTLVEQRRAGELAPRLGPQRWVRTVWERKLALESEDRSVEGALVYLVGVPARGVVRKLRRLRHRREAARALTENPANGA
ncbi:MAG: hypothetical protein QM607_07350, partial [Microbacterium sp.]